MSGLPSSYYGRKLNGLGKALLNPAIFNPAMMNASRTGATQRIRLKNQVIRQNEFWGKTASVRRAHPLYVEIAHFLSQRVPVQPQEFSGFDLIASRGG
jgi:hypothetical protein